VKSEISDLRNFWLHTRDAGTGVHYGGTGALTYQYHK